MPAAYWTSYSDWTGCPGYWKHTEASMHGVPCMQLRANAGRLAGRGVPSSLLHPDRVSVCTAADGHMPGIVDLPVT